MVDTTPMKYLIAFGALLVLGMAGVVLTHDAGPTSAGRVVADSGAAVAVLTRGDEIDIDASVPRTGWTLVEFTAAF